MRRQNYRGLILVIENEPGSVRSGVDKLGKEWKTRFYYPYGYVEGTIGKDGDGIDCFIGEHLESPSAYIVHQLRQDGLYDEDKVMLGFTDVNSARDAYLAHFNTQGFIGKITAMPIYEFVSKMRTKGQKAMRIN